MRNAMLKIFNLPDPLVADRNARTHSTHALRRTIELSSPHKISKGITKEPFKNYVTRLAGGRCPKR